MPDFRYRNFTITQTNAAMKVGTDSDLLGTLGRGGDRILPAHKIQPAVIAWQG